MYNKALFFLEKIKLKCAKLSVFENTKIWDAVIISGLQNLNLLEIMKAMI